MLDSAIPHFQENAPEKVWLQAVTEFASAHGLPVDDVLTGAMFSCNGLGFSLRYNAQLDAEGLVVMMDLGAIPDELAHETQLQMLAYNAKRPSSLVGCLGIMQGTRRGAYAVRLDVRKCQQPAQAIALMVENLARSTFESIAGLQKMFHAVSGINPADIRFRAQTAAA